MDNSLGWKQALGYQEENQQKDYREDPLKMSLARDGKAVYVKTQFDYVNLEINDQNEVNQASHDSGLKEFSENITTSIMLTETGTPEFFGKKDDGNIEVVF